MQHIWVRGKFVDWFKTCVTDCTQYFAVDGTFLTSRVVYSGIPQGSNLGPLLFLLYLNDLSRSSEILKFVDFADDTPVFLSHPISDALYVNFNEEICKVNEWLRANIGSRSMSIRPAT